MDATTLVFRLRIPNNQQPITSPSSVNANQQGGPLVTQELLSAILRKNDDGISEEELSLWCFHASKLAAVQIYNPTAQEKNWLKDFATNIGAAIRGEDTCRE